MQPRLSRQNCPLARRRGAAMILMVFMFVAMTAFAFLTLNISLLERHHAAGQISADLASRSTILLMREGRTQVQRDRGSDRREADIRRRLGGTGASQVFSRVGGTGWHR